MVRKAKMKELISKEKLEGGFKVYPIPIEKPEGGKSMRKIIIAIVTILLMFAVGYIVFDKGGAYLNSEREIYYEYGYIQGANYWNERVISTAANDGGLLYVTNETEFKLPFQQICSSQ